MEYAELITRLKRYSFPAKMAIAQTYSRKIYNSKGLVSPNELRKGVRPWTLETFLLLSIAAQEWKYDSFDGHDGQKIFIKIINAIENYREKPLTVTNSDEWINWLFAAYLPVQFDVQQNERLNFYRYHYYFTFCNRSIDLKQRFVEKFGCDYDSYIELAQLLWTAFIDNNFDRETLEIIINEFKIPASHLLLTRQQYIMELEKFSDSPEDYTTCIRPSYSYPFIEFENTFYCPLPHVLRRAVTSSMMHRLTEGDEALKRQIGKEVYEDYLFSIIKGSKLFDEVIPEQDYHHKKSEAKTVDVMCRKGNAYLFFECKSFTPKAKIRLFSEEALESDIKRLADACTQVYQHIRNRFGKEYNFFEHQGEICENDIFGMVVVQEEIFILGDRVHQKAAANLGIPMDSQDYMWLCKHVGVVPLNDIERFCFTSSDMFHAIYETNAKYDCAINWLRCPAQEEYTYEPLIEFLTQIAEQVKERAKKVYGIQ